MSHARAQQYRYLARSGWSTLLAAVIVMVAVSASQQGGGVPMVIALVLLAGCLAWTARRSWRLAGRHRVGADSERAARRALEKLARSGWVVRNGVSWPGGGDIDHLVRSPTGLGFAIETKTRSFNEEHLRRTAATARWAARRRQRHPRGVVPVLCVVRAHGVESVRSDVVIVTLDRLLASLERLALGAEDQRLGAGA